METVTNQPTDVTSDTGSGASRLNTAAQLVKPLTRPANLPQVKPRSRSHLSLTIDGQARDIDPRTLPGPLPQTRIVAVELPGDLKPRPVEKARDFLSALAVAIASQPSLCGTIKGIHHLRKGATGRRIVYFPSMKNDAQMQGNRLLEWHGMDMEQEAAVERYRCKPIRIHFIDWHYVPDILTLSRDGTFGVRAITLSGKLENTERLALLAVVGLSLNRFGVPFEVRTEQHTALPSEERRMIYLRMIKSQRIGLLLEACQDAFKDVDAWRLSDLRRHIRVLGFPEGSIERLLWERLLLANGSIAQPDKVLLRMA